MKSTNRLFGFILAAAVPAAAQTKTAALKAAPVIPVAPMAGQARAPQSFGPAESFLTPRQTLVAPRAIATASSDRFRLSAPIETWRELAVHVAARVDEAAKASSDKVLFIATLHETLDAVRKDGFRDSNGRLLMADEAELFVSRVWGLEGRAGGGHAGYAEFSAEIVRQLARLAGWSKTIQTLPELLSAFDRLIDEAGPGLPKPPRPFALSATARQELAGAIEGEGFENRKKP